MLDDNKIKEEINIAYVLSVAAIKSFSTEITRIDLDSIDASINYNGYITPESTLYSPSIKLQLKATSSADIHGTTIHFPLSIKNYEDLRARTANPRLLVILCLPEGKTNWINHSVDQLILKKCAYYLSLKDAPATKNETSVTVHVPMTNVFSPETLYDLMVKTSKELAL
jgi:hypothetical protein